MTSTPTSKDLAKVPDLNGLNDMLSPLAMRAGWNKAEPSLWVEPRTGFRPAKWSWENARAALNSAGRLINTEQAERRNLFMVNPKEGNTYATLRTLVSAYQMILPGERARSHRHSPNALRLVLDVAEDCYTVVNGVRLDMEPGDVLLTPNWAWHGHANDGRRPGYWIDYLDTPLVHLLEPMFLEDFPDGFQDPDPSARLGDAVFPWRETERSLAEAAPDADGVRRVRLGEPALPTIALEMAAYPAGYRGQIGRTTASQIVTAVSGSGRSSVGDDAFSWSRGDVIAIPSWTPFAHVVEEDSVLFCVSDRPVVEKLGFFRTEG